MINTKKIFILLGVVPLRPLNTMINTMINTKKKYYDLFLYYKVTVIIFFFFIYLFIIIYFNSNSPYDSYCIFAAGPDLLAFGFDLDILSPYLSA